VPVVALGGVVELFNLVEGPEGPGTFTAKSLKSAVRFARGAPDHRLII
jgi:hypothetical protein